MSATSVERCRGGRTPLLQIAPPSSRLQRPHCPEAPRTASQGHYELVHAPSAARLSRGRKLPRDNCRALAHAQFRPHGLPLSRIYRGDLRYARQRHPEPRLFTGRLRIDRSLPAVACRHAWPYPASVSSLCSLYRLTEPGTLGCSRFCVGTASTARPTTPTHWPCAICSV